MSPTTIRCLDLVARYHDVCHLRRQGYVVVGDEELLIRTIHVWGELMTEEREFVVTVMRHHDDRIRGLQ